MIRSASLAAALAAALFATPAFASGGGGSVGGGSGPSASTRDDPSAAYQAGVAALQARNYAEAVRHLRTARRALPGDGAINYALGLAYVGDNRNDDATEAFERAARAANAPPGARLQLGLLYIGAGRRDDAQAQLEALNQAVSACDAACGDARRTQWQAAHDQLQHALEAPAAPAPQNPATSGWNFPSVGEGRQAYADAIGLINQDRFSDALTALARAEAAVGPNADVFNYMGFASRKLGRLDEALAYYQQALSLDPQHLGATEYLGELYIQMGDLSAARRQLAQLDQLCAYGCAQHEELARWIDLAAPRG